jgi:hypothetical protein
MALRVLTTETDHISQSISIDVLREDSIYRLVQRDPTSEDRKADLDRSGLSARGSHLDTQPILAEPGTSSNPTIGFHCGDVRHDVSVYHIQVDQCCISVETSKYTAY